MIPKVIHQTWLSKEKNDSLDKLRTTWTTLNPSFVYKYYDDDDIKTYIQTHFDERFQHAYGRILNGSLKADFFRYCVLYHEGGVYIDVDISCLKPLEDVFDFEQFNVITSTDYCRIQRTDRIYQGFLAGEAKSGVFINMVTSICDAMEKNLHKNNLFLLSGPTAFSTQLKMYMNQQVTDPLEKCSFLKELYYTNLHKQQHYCIVTHDISKEVLSLKGTIFAKAQNKFDRGGALHYFQHKSKFKEGYYI